MDEYHVLVKEKVLQQNLYYKDQIIMRYTIKYPKFISDSFQIVIYKLNALYRTKAVMYERSNITNLYQMAMVEYEYSRENNIPMRQFEAYVDYIITYNENCTVSLYFDQYEYAGGAHGLTYRYSDTWNLQTGKRVELNELISNTDKNRYKDFIIQEIINQIKYKTEEEDFSYFEDYPKLVEDNFKVNNFYITEEGVVIYFQQYDIAPYAYGLPVFLIPFSPLGAKKPKCT